ncbi:hypothetical protein ACFY2K_27770 [Kitasatospora sp. NPDC001309]|uniref:hypothetical protein n=1 Tax=Kitasatospora sp. NPDC001309 TaxID=3364013 RepID=UPI0036CA2941
MAVIVLVMQTTASFWDSLVFDGIDDLDVEAVTALFGTVEVVARGRGAGVPGCRGGVSGLWPLLGPGARPISPQIEGSSAR